MIIRLRLLWRCTLRLKGNDRPPTFEAAVRRSCGYLIDCCGMKDLKDYVRSDATKVP